MAIICGGRSCPNKQPVRFFVEGSVAIPLVTDWLGEYHLAFFRIHNLHSAQRGNENG
jgi:hypothetical protein